MLYFLRTETFPKSANVWDSLAEACLKAGDIKSAKYYYEKSLQLDPKTENAKQNLRKIKEPARK